MPAPVGGERAVLQVEGRQADAAAAEAESARAITCRPQAGVADIEERWKIHTGRRPGPRSDAR